MNVCAVGRVASLTALIGLATLALAANARADAHATVIAEIERHARAHGVSVGVSALHLPSGRRVQVNADEKFPLASTYKVPMAAYALHLVGEGELALDQLIEVRSDDLGGSSSSSSMLRVLTRAVKSQ